MRRAEGQESDGATAMSYQLSPIEERYLELMKQCLTRYLFIDEEMDEVEPSGWRAIAYGPVRRFLRGRGLQLGRLGGGDRSDREVGRDWPPYAETMVGLRRLENVQACVSEVIRSRVRGDLIETGVWRGGTSIFMRATLAAFGDADRRVWVADSFRGLPPPGSRRFSADEGLDLSSPLLSVSLEQVKANFGKYGLLDAQVEFLVGWFKDTLPSAPIDHLAVIRLDGDLYESTMDALSALYPKLSLGGYVIIDDYYCFDACRQAVTDYRQAHGVTDAIEGIDWTGAYWRRTI